MAEQNPMLLYTTACSYLKATKILKGALTNDLYHPLYNNAGIATELFFKSILQKKDNKFEKTHNLEKLFAEVSLRVDLAGREDKLNEWICVLNQNYHTHYHRYPVRGYAQLLHPDKMIIFLEELEKIAFRNIQ